MKILRLLVPLGAMLVAGCANTNFLPYQTTSTPEDVEWSRDSLDIYPDDVRQNPALYDGATVAWAGVIRESDAREFGDGYIRITTTFEHHYFDWQQNGIVNPSYDLSPHGEGLFKADWIVKKTYPDADAAEAQRYAAPGKLCIVYGTPTSVDTNGVVQLRYRFLRMINADEYTTEEFDYGRFGQPFVYLR